MNRQKKSRVGRVGARRNKIAYRGRLEPLERRRMMAVQYPFAKFAGRLDFAGDVDSIPIHIGRNSVETKSGSAILGIQISPLDGSLNPAVAAMSDVQGQPLSEQKGTANLADGKSSLAIVRVTDGEYTLRVAAEAATIGAYQVDVFLPGDINGDYNVNIVDFALLRRSYGAASGDSRYIAAADQDLNGRVSGFDYLTLVRNFFRSVQTRPLEPPAIRLADGITIQEDGLVVARAEASQIVGTTQPNASVELDANGDGIFAEGATKATPSGEFSFPVNIENGLQAIRVRAKDSLGQSGDASLTILRDGQSPQVQVLSPQGFSAKQTFQIEGLAADQESGIREAFIRLDGGAKTMLSLDAHGRFRAPIELATDGTLDGRHTLTISAIDQAGNNSPPITWDFLWDTTGPAIRIDSPLLGGIVNKVGLLQGQVRDAGGAIDKLEYSLDGASPIAISARADGSFEQPLYTSQLRDGIHILSITASDAVGNTSKMQMSIEIKQGFRVLSHTPYDGAFDVGSTFRPQIYFSKPVDPTSVTSETLFAAFGDQKLPMRIVVANDGSFAWLFPQSPMPGAANIEVVVKGDIRSADGESLDGDSNGAPGGDLSFRFSTVNLTPLLGTSLAGRLVDPGADLQPHTADDSEPGPDGRFGTADDVYLLPIRNVEVSVVGLPQTVVHTDSQGRFYIGAVPIGNVKIDTNGRTALNAPDGYYFPSMVMDANMELGKVNNIMPEMETMYLPRLANAILSTVNNATGAELRVVAEGARELTDAQRQLIKLTVAPGSLIGASGAAAAAGSIGLSTVPAELVRDMLPPGILQHSFDITIQALGVETFATPAALTFPNIFNAPSGEKLNLLSFDHTTGRLVIEGTGTVSADGLTISTDPGVGITHPGWHGWVPPSSSPSGGGPASGPGGPGGGCGPGGDDEIVIPESKGVYDQFFVSDEGELQFQFRNNAPKPDSSGKCPSGHPSNLKVSFSYDSKEKGDAFLEELPTSSLVLGPQEESKTITVKLKDLVKTATIKGKQIEVVKEAKYQEDTLFGVTMTVEYRSGKGKFLGRDEVHFYRLLDVADTKHSDGEIEMADTATVGVVRERPIQLEVGDKARPTFQVTGGGLFDNPGAFPMGGEAIEAFKFSPSEVKEDISATLKLMNPKNVEVMPSTGKRLRIFGDGKLQKFGIDEARLDAALRNLATTNALSDTLKAQLGSADGAVRRAVIDAAKSHVLQIYGDALRGMQQAGLGIIDALNKDVIAVNRFEQKDWEIKDPKSSDYGLVSPGVDDSSDATSEFSGGLGGPFDILLLKNVAGEAELAFRLAQSLNQDPGGGMDVYLDRFRKGTSPGSAMERVYSSVSELAQMLGKTIAHEMGHALGLRHVRTSNDDVMKPAYGQDDREGAVRFIEGEEALRMALGLEWDSADGKRALAYMDTAIHSDYPGIANASQTSFPYVPPEPEPLFSDPHLHVLYESGSFANALQFPTVTADGAGGAFAAKELQLTNDGALPLVINSVIVAGSNAFRVDAPTQAFTLAPLETRKLIVQFDPQSGGLHNGELRINNQGITTEFNLQLSGSGLSPVGDLQIIATSTNMGGDLVADGVEVFRQEAITLRNEGNGPLTLTSLQLREDAQSQFSLVNAPQITQAQPLVLPAGGSLALNVAFAAQQLGLQRAMLHITSDDADTPSRSLAISGTGMLPDELSLSFGRDNVVLELPFEPGRPTFRQISDDKGNWSFVTPPNTPLRYRIFDPDSGLIGASLNSSGPSGAKTVDRPPLFTASVAPDSDFDGLPDDIEFTLGSSLTNSDTDSDGIDDFQELRARSNPIGDDQLALGQVSQVAVPGAATDVTIAASPLNPLHAFAYVATAPLTASGTLSIVDISSPRQPIVLGAVALAGIPMSVAVDGNAKLAVVGAGDAGVHLVDISNPVRPERVLTLTFPSAVTRVAAYAGSAYLISGAQLVQLDLATRKQVRSVTLGAAPLVDVANFGDRLFTLDQANTLRAFDLSTGEPIAKGVLNLPSFSQQGRIFTTESVIYVTGRNGSAAQGYLTVNGAAIDDLRLLSGIDNGEVGFANTDLAFNGSGLVVMAGAQPGQPPSLDLLDAQDPSTTDRFLTRINVSALPSAVAIGQGVAVLPTGASGVQLVNFLQTDVAGVAPTVSAYTTLTDLQPSVPALQVKSGELLPFHAQIVEDVQARSAELLINGQLVATDFTFPFDFEYALPAVSTNTPLAVQVRVTDIGGNAGLSNVLSIESLPAAPRVAAVTPQPDARVETDVDRIEIQLDRAIQSGALSASDFAIQGAGKDGQFGTLDDLATSFASFRVNDSRKLLTLQLASPLPSSRYRVVLPSAKLRDDAGLKLDGEFMGSLPSGNGTAGGDFVYEFEAAETIVTLPPDVFPLSRVRMVGLAENEKVDDRSEQLSGLALDQRGNSNVLTVDVNADGRLDIVRATFGKIFQPTDTGTQSRTFDVVGVSLQGEDGDFSEAVNFNVGAHPRQLLAGDVNGDDNLDLITINVDSTTNGAVTLLPIEVSILLGDGTGGFKAEIRQSTNRTVSNRLFELPSAAIDDFNQDGKQDIALHVLNGATIQSPFFVTTSEISIFAGQGDGRFTTPEVGTLVESKSFTQRRELFAGDLNGDKWPDLVTSEQILINQQNGGYVASLAPGNEGQRLLALADFDGDQDSDILAETSGGGNAVIFSILRNDGAGNYTVVSSPGVVGLQSNGAGAAIDLNADGILDWAATTSASFVTVNLANANLTFQPTIRLPINYLSSTARAFVNIAGGDVDRDGAVDLVITRQGDEGVFIVRGTGGGSLDLPLDSLPRVSGSNSFPVIGNSKRELVDVTGDGILDLIAREGYRFAEGKGDGKFKAVIQPPNIQGLAAHGFVNNDATRDLVSTDGFGNVFYHQGIGQGNLAAAARIATLNLNGFQDGVRAIELADVNGDGMQDVVIARTKGMTVLIGDGNGGFDAPVSTSIGITGLQMHVADLNQDKRSDVIVLRSTGLTPLLANTDGTFEVAAALTNPPSNIDYRLALGDFNADGKFDVAATLSRPGFGTVSELRLYDGDGTGGFSAGKRLAVDDFFDLRAADINRDGHLDLITAGLHEVAILAGMGNGAWGAARRFDLAGPQFGFPSDLLVGDLNGDSRLDLVDYAFVLLQRE